MGGQVIRVNVEIRSYNNVLQRIHMYSLHNKRGTLKWELDRTIELNEQRPLAFIYTYFVLELYIHFHQPKIPSLIVENLSASHIKT